MKDIVKNAVKYFEENIKDILPILNDKEAVNAMFAQYELGLHVTEYIDKYCKTHGKDSAVASCRLRLAKLHEEIMIEVISLCKINGWVK